MALRLTLTDILKQPANFMYLWADEKLFLQKIDARSAAIIRAKKANQKQVLTNAVTASGYTDGMRQIGEAFQKMYGMTPAKALVTLANGGEVAGKNWSEGVYGVGKRPVDFVQGNGSVTVNPTTGALLLNGTAVAASQMNTVYGRDRKGNVIVSSNSYTDANGNTYTSQYNKTTKTYYAASYSAADGTKQDASGNAINNSMDASVWTSIIESFQSFIDWLISLFTSGKQQITAKNTLPNQGTDGFVQQAGAPWWLIGGLALGVLFYGMPKITGEKKGKKK